MRGLSRQFVVQMADRSCSISRSMASFNISTFDCLLHDNVVTLEKQMFHASLWPQDMEVLYKG